MAVYSTVLNQHTVCMRSSNIQWILSNNNEVQSNQEREREGNLFTNSHKQQGFSKNKSKNMYTTHLNLEHSKIRIFMDTYGGSVIQVCIIYIDD